MLKHFPSLELYSHPKIIAVGILGIVSGLPLALTFSTLSIWLTEVGISKSAIGLFALIGTPYVIKFLWAPLIDHMPLPYITNKLGRRRAWIIFSQICLIISLILLGSSNPLDNPWNTALLALIVTICSATQDIVIDAYRIEILNKDQQGAGAAIIVFGYRIGMLISSAGALVLSSYYGWFATYVIMAALISIGMITVFIMGEPKTEITGKATCINDFITRAVIEPFSEFMGRSGWLLILIFIVLYKLGDAFAGVMTGPFLIDIGFSKVEIAAIVKTYGFVAVIAGSFVGGAMVARMGMIKSLWICGILQMLSNLMFVAQAQVGYDDMFLILTISIENFSGGMGTTAFVAYISRLCNVNYTATQYALFSALAATGRTWLSASSGFVVDSFGWVDFFIISTIIALPGLLLLFKVEKLK